jgi:hypothetical protein
MSEQKITCPFMTGAALLIQDISRMIVNPNNAKVAPGGNMSILATPADHRVLCLGEECGFKLCPSSKGGVDIRETFLNLQAIFMTISNKLKDHRSENLREEKDEG